jgi:hypothetical protein
MNRTSHSSHRSWHIKDVAIYIAVGVAVNAYILTCMFAGLSFAWIILSLETLLVFCYFIAAGRRQWSAAFWTLTGGLLLIHVAIVPLIFRAYTTRIDHGMAFWMAVGTILEMAAFEVAREQVLPRLAKLMS